MDKSNMWKQHGKTMLILALCLCVPFISIWYIANYVNENIFYDQKEGYLMAFARVLDTQLCEGGYNALLAAAGVEKDAPKDEQIAALNAALREITDEVAHSSRGLGVGYYSRELDAILTYGPSEDYDDTVGKPIAVDHPGRRVMA
ncbi:MAG: hybrid sensor histidine kinase/response regulator, partial [Firmicutes bacterium]|nr:hybrid sensor histidine kinase/response regulator [Bacillota bacterium]